MFICRKGHESYLVSGECRQCKTEYMRRYRASSPDERAKERLRKTKGVCRNGHESERTPSGSCRQCRSEYMRRYRTTMRLENPEKWKEYMRKKSCSRSYTTNKAKYMKRYFERRNAAYVALKELGIEV